MIDLLIKNGTVVTMNPERSVFETGSVAVHEGEIVEVGDRLEDQPVPAGHGALDRAARVGRAVPAERRAPQVELAVGGSTVVAAYALVGVALGVAVPE